MALDGTRVLCLDESKLRYFLLWLKIWRTLKILSYLTAAVA